MLVVIALVAGCADERTWRPCATCGTGVHAIGILDPKSDNFHGKLVERTGWNFPLCQSCHGADFRGKANAPSCMTCHDKGPTSCGTCHAEQPTTGAHDKHVIERGYTCTECHVMPATWDSPGHLLDEQGVPLHAPRVTFGALANHGAQATYDPATKQCSVYCHGTVLGDAAATLTRPTWDAGAAAAACGTCHGNPPASHARTDCATCHPAQTSTSHVDGTIDLGNGSGTCTACHGSPPATGAHLAHANAGRLRGPIACTECHVVPATVTTPGHIDHAQPVLAFGTLATTDGAAGTWDAATATCSNVYCHGGGTHLTAEPSAGKQASQSWSGSTASTIYCGACHGLPPSDMFHPPTLQLTDCATCHPNTVGPFGNILVGNGKHINGAVDLN